MRRIILLLVLAAGVVPGCKTLHPESPELPASILARLAPQFPPLATHGRRGGTLAFTEQREAANQAVKDVLAIKPAVYFDKAKPVTLAIAEVGQMGIETIRQEQKDAWRKALEATGTVRVVFISSVILSSNPRFHEIRVAAARLHADCVLLYASATSRDWTWNLWSVFYLTVVGAFVAPGSQDAVLTFAKGVCFDVENEYLQFVVEGEDERSSVRPWYFTDDDGLARESRKAALDLLRQETVRALEAKTDAKKK